MTGSTAWFEPGRHLNRPTPSDFERGADYLEWVFYLPPGTVTQNVCARDVANALHDLVTASFDQVGNPLEVRLAWQNVMDTMGPMLFNQFIRMRAWEDFCPPVSPIHDTTSKHVLWVGHDKRVVLRLTYKNDVAVDQKLWIEDLE